MIVADDVDYALTTIRIHERLARAFHKGTMSESGGYPWERTSYRYRKAVIEGVKAVISEMASDEIVNVLAAASKERKL